MDRFPTGAVDQFKSDSLRGHLHTGKSAMDNDDKSSNTKSTRKVTLAMGMIAVLVIIFLLVLWIFFPEPPVEPKISTPGLPQQTLPEPAPEPEPVPEPTPPSEDESAAPPEEPEEPLPTLGESDQVVREEVEQLPNGPSLLPLLVRDDLILKAVRAVTALEENALVNKYRPIVPPQSPFEAEEMGEPASEDEPQKYLMTEQTYGRYDSYINLLTSLDNDRLAALYNRYYPLLEQAYEEQGVDKGSFREVTLTAIDNLLEAPVIEEDIILVRPSVMYKYSDPELEALPPAHKLMLRLGPDNSRKLKDVLRRLRTELEE